MKTIKLISIVVLMLAAISATAAARQGSQSTKSVAARAVVVSLYNQHKKRSPFFQTRSRALLDKYFTRELAALLWNDARSAGDEVGALDGDPLYNAQEIEITNFAVQAATIAAAGAAVPVSFQNLGQKHQIMFRLVPERAGWKIANLEYDDGASLVQILKSDSAGRQMPIKIYLVAVGDDGKTGKKIGCGDSLVAVTRSINKTKTPLGAAVRELLSTPPQTDGTPNLENFWKGRNLKLQSVSILNQTATIRIAGEVFVAGVCDEPRIQSQIEETARQFPNVKRVKVFIGKRTLAQAIR
ncbi:MAG TPA: GerMN domain-containing protein [Pyrinomonadaceae bacterium]|jgi:hypothetical protein|nr:GerMN domain-containing protein [Pyrinomonadaceae bacterium]